MKSYINLTSILFGVLLILFSNTFIDDVFAADWYDSDWTYAKKITIDSSQVDVVLTDFPLLVNYTSTDVGSNAQSDCDDILFTDNTNSTKHSHEIENCDLTLNDWFTAWVKVPSISNSTDTDLFMYYGNTGASNQEDVTGTFSDYDMVLHLHDDFLDSTSNSNDGTNNGSTNTSCLIADCQSFDRVNDRITVADDPTLTLPDSEWSIMWMMAFDDVTTSNTFQYMISQDDVNTSPSLNILLLENSDANANDSQLKVIMIDGDGGMDGFISNAPNDFVTSSFTESDLLSMSTYVLQRESDGDVYLYVDGVEKHSDTPNGTFDAVDSTGALFLGSRNDVSSSRMFGGELDEIRFRDSAYSTGWLTAEYDSHKSGTTFISVGDQGTESGGPGPSDPNSDIQQNGFWTFFLYKLNSLIWGVNT